MLRTVLVLLSLGVANRAGSALACDPMGETNYTVVGINAGQTQVLLRGVEKSPAELEALAPITLSVFDLATEKIVKSWPIVSNDDPSAARAGLRATRWKAAEAELTSEGFKLVPNLAPLNGPPFSLGGGVELLVTVQTVGEADYPETRYDLEARAGTKKVVFREGFRHYPSSTGRTEDDRVRSAYLTPDGRFLLLMGGACDLRALGAVRVADVLKKLGR